MYFSDYKIYNEHAIHHTKQQIQRFCTSKNAERKEPRTMKYQKKITLSSVILLAAAILFLQNYAWAKSRIGLNKSSITLTAGDSRKLSLKGISVIDNVYHSENERDIHYHAYFPDSYYESTESYALFITLPGYQGLYFQGVAENIRTEDFAFEAQKYNSKMVILAPQLNDWSQTSADQTLALTEYFLEHYRIDPSKVYIEGYSGGGETLSLVLGKKPELFAAALMCSSQWDGDYEPVVRAKTPVYFVIGESDEYYSSRPFKNAYRTLLNLYKEQGLSETEIKNLLVLDVKDASYFTGTGITYQHGGGYLFCRDEQIMGWLFAD